MFNCCEGDDVCWRTLRREYPACQVVGFDLKKKRGRVAIDSSRVLSLDGCRYDAVDIDTYGHPFKHLFALMRAMPEGAVTVFLTFGRIKYGGAHSEIVKLAGLDGFSVKPPVSLASKAVEDSLSYAFTHECASKIVVAYAAEAFPRGNARYIGLRLEKHP